jgi:SET domain-containing protein
MSKKKLIEHITRDVYCRLGVSKVKTLDVLYASPNYSKKHNVSITKGNKGGYAGFVTNRKIKKGEELFINYDDYE